MSRQINASASKVGARRTSSRRRGTAIVYLGIFMVVGTALCSLAVDYGRVQLAKTELRSAADAAARAGAKGALTSAAQGRTDAIAVAGGNKADGSVVALVNSNIDVGNWSNNAFTINGTPSNAVRVRADRTAGAGNAIPLLFARMLGSSFCDVHASAVAYADPAQPRGFIGLRSISMKNNAFVGSYDSSTNPTPTHGSAGSAALLGSNGAIDGKNNNDLYGTAMLGPSGSINGVSVHGSTTVQPGGIQKPAATASAPGANPGGVAQNYTVNSTVTLAGGTYWFTSLNISGALKFSGPTTLYVNGDITLDGKLQPTSLLPSDLKIYQIGSRTFGEAGSNGMDIVASIVAPDTTFTAKNNLSFRGSGVFDTFSVAVKNNVDLYYDTSMGTALGSVTIHLVQ